MMAPRRRRRLYWKRGRAYGDFRDYRDVGGSREALKSPGSAFATEDEDEARVLLARRLDDLKSLRQAFGDGLVADPHLSDYARVHLESKRMAVRESTFVRIEIVLRRFVGFFGDPRLSEIKIDDIRTYVRVRSTEPGTRGRRIQPRTIRKELGQLANLYSAAILEDRAVKNPVLQFRDWPRVDATEPEFFEPGEVARMLEVAADLASDPHRRTVPFLSELLATLALTGGRRSEVYGLLCSDVDFERGVVHFRPNQWRRLKTRLSQRTVPLWPQLRAYLEPYVTEGTDDLLFPGRGGMLTELGYTYDIITRQAEIDRRLRPHGLRHTYAASRMQTLDNDHPVSPYTVARELGHSDVTLVERLYGHLQKSRVRSPVVEYREAEVISLGRKGLGA